MPQRHLRGTRSPEGCLRGASQVPYRCLRGLLSMLEMVLAMLEGVLAMLEGVLATLEEVLAMLEGSKRERERERDQ